MQKNRKNKGDEEMINSRTKRLDVRTNHIRMTRIRFKRWFCGRLVGAGYTPGKNLKCSSHHGKDNGSLTFVRF